MAEFCNDCAKRRGWPVGDLAGVTGWLEWLLLRRSQWAVCEDCGLIAVDPRGNKVQQKGGKDASMSEMRE